MEDFIGFIALSCLVAIYFLPAAIAHYRKNHQANAIAMFNLFLGWTFVGWVLSLVWSVTAINHQHVDSMGPSCG